jgi:hypothetical protein
VGVILTKQNFVKHNCHRSTKRVLFHHDKTIKHLFIRCTFARFICSVIQVSSTLYLSCSIANIFDNWLSGVDHWFKILIRLVTFCHYLVTTGMLKWQGFNDTILHSSRLSTCAQLYSIHDRFYKVPRITICISGCLHDWRTLWGIFLSIPRPLCSFYKYFLYCVFFVLNLRSFGFEQVYSSYIEAR